MKISILGSGGSKGYSQAWLWGEGPAAHAHEGIRLEDRSGWVAIGETLADDQGFDRSQVRRYSHPGWSMNYMKTSDWSISYHEDF